MSTNDIFSKDRLCKVIKTNLFIFRQCLLKGSNIYKQRTAILMLMQFIEYVLKYKIQCAGNCSAYAYLGHFFAKLR